MKIIFICGSLESGHDGVGDYSQKLADEFKINGHKIALIALNDKYIDGINRGTSVENISFLRLSSKTPWKTRMVEAKKFIDLFKPDYLSLQYVPYSFQNKGLPFELIKHLKNIGNDYSWHVMFHETWVGIKEKSPFSHKFYKFLQKRIAKSLITNLKPKFVSTSNKLYQLVLQKIGINAHILTLFSNISIAPIDNQFVSSIYEQLAIDKNKIKQNILVGVFGNIHATKELLDIINNEIIQAAKQMKIINIIIFGRLNSQENLISFKEIYKNKIKITYVGELSEKQISSVLQILDIGLSSTPAEYISKSGVYAAMKLHNVPVIAPSSMRIPKYETEILKFNEFLDQREYYKWNVDYIAKELYENLRLHTQL